MQREQMAPEIVQTQRESCFRGSMVLQDRWILDEPGGDADPNLCYKVVDDDSLIYVDDMFLTRA
jgi:hypothetical protein